MRLLGLPFLHRRLRLTSHPPRAFSLFATTLQQITTTVSLTSALFLFGNINSNSSRISNSHRRTFVSCFASSLTPTIVPTSSSAHLRAAAAVAAITGTPATVRSTNTAYYTGNSCRRDMSSLSEASSETTATAEVAASSSATGSALSSSFYTQQYENLIVVLVPSLDDNYGFLIHDIDTQQTIAIDTPEAATYTKELQHRGWTLTHIFNTHHHGDHTGGNLELQQQAQGTLDIIGPATETIPGITHPVVGGDTLSNIFSTDNTTKIEILDVGGHTKGHIAYYFPQQQLLFVGDALFVMGCGRMFEGTPSQYWQSLQRLRALPDATVVYCAHEYTLANTAFALSMEPTNGAIHHRAAKMRALRQQGVPTVPTTLGDEKLTNPFLRGDVSAEIQTTIGYPPPGKEEENDEFVRGSNIFAAIRQAKDRF